MMNLNRIVLIIALLIVGSAYSQQYPGYFGKKTYIEVLTTSGLPLFANFWGCNGGYNNEGGQLVRQDEKWGAPWEWYQFGLNIAVGRAIKNNLAVGFEYSRHNWKINGPGSPFDDVAGISSHISVDKDGNEIPYPYKGQIVHERIRTVRQTFMPRIEFATGDGLLPMGLTHIVGLGLTITSKVQDDYLIGFEEFYNYVKPIPDSVYSTTDLIDYDIKYKGLQLMYGIKMRSPLGKSLFLTYGMRYMLNIRIGRGDSLYYESAEYSVRKFIVRNNLLNLMSFDLGLSVPF